MEGAVAAVLGETHRLASSDLEVLWRKLRWLMGGTALGGTGIGVDAVVDIVARPTHNQGWRLCVGAGVCWW